MSERMSIIERFFRWLTGKPAGGAAMVQSIDVRVRPTGPASGREVPCRIIGDSHHNVIFLDYDQEYEITFRLDAVHGVRHWNAVPFGNQENACPPPGQGPTGGFSSNPGTTQDAIIVHVDPIPRASGQRVEKYRLNFNDSLTCDPIIIVG